MRFVNLLCKFFVFFFVFFVFIMFFIFVIIVCMFIFIMFFLFVARVDVDVVVGFRERSSSSRRSFFLFFVMI